MIFLYHIDDIVEFLFVNIISFVIFIEFISFDFILQSFVSIMITRVQYIVYQSFVIIVDLHEFKDVKHLIIHEIIEIFSKKIEMKIVLNFHVERQFQFIKDFYALEYLVKI